MAKKLLSVLLAVMMIFSIVAVSTVSSAAAEADRTIYFELPTEWQAARAVYAHIWGHEGAGLYSWQDTKSKMKKVDASSPALWYYEVPESDAEEFDLIIFSTDSSIGTQTFDTTFGVSAFGDTAYVLDEQIENPKDSTKTAYVAAWRGNTSYGPYITITSSGHVVGYGYFEGETAETIVAAFVKAHGDPELDNGLSDTQYWPEYTTDEKIAEYTAEIAAIIAANPLPDPPVTEPTTAGNGSDVGTNPPSTEPVVTEPTTAASTQNVTERPTDPYGRKPGIPLPSTIANLPRYTEGPLLETHKDWDGTYKIYYFQAPPTWLENADLKETYHKGEKDEQKFEIGFYWYNGEENGGSWPGVPAVKLDLPGLDNVYYGIAPSYAPFILWNNGINGDLDDNHFAKSIQTKDLNVQDEVLNNLEVPNLTGTLTVLNNDESKFTNPFNGIERTVYGADFYYFDPQDGTVIPTTTPLTVDGEIITDADGFALHPFYDLDYDYVNEDGEVIVPVEPSTLPPAPEATTAATTAKTGSSSSAKDAATVKTSDIAALTVLLTLLTASIAVVYLARKRENA
ncbi:hypothetical protein AGMMS50284_5670 [Clostridia bacterium]|nr:hypothetical protein AGMMS50284_5670 [Clostridia bacterium]